MTKKAIIINKPSSNTLSLVEELKRCKKEVVIQMRSKRDLSIDLSV